MSERTFVLLLTVVLVLAACGKSAEQKAAEKAEKAFEKQTGGKAQIDLTKGKMTFKDKTGESVEIANKPGAVAIPADFPKDVFVYPGATPAMSLKSAEGTTLNLSTTDAAGKVSETYKEKMKAEGWTQETALEQPQMIMLSYNKGERRAMVHISPEDGGAKTQIMLVVEEPKTQK